jgi:sugar lactone lactonase YvrE
VTTPTPVWEIATQLGEGPVWLAGEGVLRFVDIKSGNLHGYNPATGEHETLIVGGKPSFIAPTDKGGLLVGSGNAVRKLEGDKLGPAVTTVTMPAHNRTNDATVDGQGRLWFGTMDDAEQQATGALYCLDRSTLHRVGGDAVVTNGPAISRDGKTLYHVDSGARTIWRFSIGDGPILKEGTVFVQLGDDEGYPDGVVLDSEDCLWVALWDGWGVRRYAPGGGLLLHVAFPCARVTKLAFGGPDLRTAYVTSARTGLSEAQLAAQPLAGSLFAFAAPVAGVALPPVRL